MTTPQPPFALSAGDKVSSAWQRLHVHYTQRLKTLREQNDSTNNTPEKTAFLRGQIAEVKALLALEQEPFSID